MTEQPAGMDPVSELPTGMDQLDPAPAAASPPPPPRDTAEDAVLRDLAKMPEELRESAVAVTALMLARSLDAGEMLSRDQVGCVREIRMCMTQLREWNPAGASGDETDETRARTESVRALYAVQAE